MKQQSNFAKCLKDKKDACHKHKDIKFSDFCQHFRENRSVQKNFVFSKKWRKGFFYINLGLGGTIEGQRDEGVRHPLISADFVVVPLAVPVLLRGGGLELVRHVQVEAVEAADKAGGDAVLAHRQADEVLDGGPGDTCGSRCKFHLKNVGGDKKIQKSSRR